MRRTASSIMVTLLFLSLFVYAFTVQSVKAEQEATNLTVSVFDESGFAPPSLNGASSLPGVPMNISTLSGTLVASGTTNSNGATSFLLPEGDYNITYGGVQLPDFGEFGQSSKIIHVMGASMSTDLYCFGIAYHNYQGGDPFLLNYVDLNTSSPGSQYTITVQPGQQINAEFSWWELETSDWPIWYVSVFGSWSPTVALGNLATGEASPSSDNLHTVPLNFTAPTTPGTYQVRMVGVLDYTWPNSFYTHNHYQPSLGRDIGIWIISQSLASPYAIGTIIVEASQPALTLTVHSSHDSPNPPNGDNYYIGGSSVTCSVTSPVSEGNTIWTCTGWSGTGSVPANGPGTTVTFTITQNSSITWNWQGLTFYNASFVESGLPPGAQWAVTFNGQTQDSTSSSITFSAINGVYHFSITSPAGYSASPSSGTITVNEANTAELITFSQVFKLAHMLSLSILVLSLFAITTLSVAILLIMLAALPVKSRRRRIK